MLITSINNQKIKHILKLKEIKNVKKYSKYFLDGLHLVEEAILYNKSNIEEIFIVENFNKKNSVDLSSFKITYITEQVAKHISETVNTQGIFAICNIQDEKVDINKYSKVVILDKIQDPGNLGTIIRTADAFGYDCVILGKGTTSIYNQKVIRSMQGSNFHIDCYDNIDLLEELDNMENFNIFATSLDTDNYIDNITKIDGKIAIIFGNEANGVSEEVMKKVNKKIKIEMKGKAESLNVAVSAGILMHHIGNISK